MYVVCIVCVVSSIFLIRSEQSSNNSDFLMWLVIINVVCGLYQHPFLYSFLETIREYQDGLGLIDKTAQNSITSARLCSDWQIFEKLLIYSQSLCQKSAERKLLKQYSFVFRFVGDI